MLIKIMPYRSDQRQRICDVARHVRYLLAGRIPGDGSIVLMRLACPPHTRQLVQRVLPVGCKFRAAATDIARL